jgi:threonine/homoserine/homoserine lactone efflux protein
VRRQITLRQDGKDPNGYGELHMPVAFWLGIGSTMIANEKAALDPKDQVVFFAGFLSSALLWSVFLAGLLAWGQRFVTPLFFRLVNLICGLALGFFAFKQQETSKC